MKFSMQVGLGPGHIVLDGDPGAPPSTGAQPPPIFGPCLLCPNGSIKMPLGVEVGLDPSNIVLDGDPAPSPQKGRG